MAIVNVTQHKASPEQVAAGVVDLPEDLRQQLCELLTFSSCPAQAELAGRAVGIRELVGNFHHYHMSEFENEDLSVMLGGAPFFMSTLELAFYDATVLYSFSLRESVESVVDGVVRKSSVFKHVGFVESVNSSDQPLGN